MEKIIVLKKISLLNFKGIGSRTFQFSQRETSIAGANGTGKSSLYAAFVWCLFGKDQFGRADYQLKTLVNGKSDRNKQCEVEIILEINGYTTKLCRVYYEK
jgi:chromosome segregation ATPase